MHTRYSKQTILPQVGEEGQNKLINAKVLIIGAGGLGSNVAPFLAGAGIGYIGIIDDDNVSLNNLNRQVFYAENQIGLNKAETLKKICASINSEIIIKEYDFAFNENFKEFNYYDLIIDCTDNFNTKYLIEKLCLINDKPFISASVEGWKGQFGIFNVNGSGSYSCIFPQKSIDLMRPVCDDIGIVGAIAGIIATHQALLAIKFFLGIHENELNKFYLFDGLTNKLQSFKFKRNEGLIQEIINSGKNNQSSRDQFITSKFAIENQFLIIDLRQKHVVEDDNKGYINIEFDQVLADPEQILVFTKPIAFYCEKGAKSQSLAQYLKEKLRLDIMVIRE
jgi:adenylyltransferase/sulfurtransferase